MVLWYVPQAGSLSLKVPQAGSLRYFGGAGFFGKTLDLLKQLRILFSDFLYRVQVFQLAFLCFAVPFERFL